MVSEHCRDYIIRHFLKKLFSLLGYIKNFIYQLLCFAVMGWGILRRRAWIQAWLQQDHPVPARGKRSCTCNISGDTPLSWSPAGSALMQKWPLPLINFAYVSACLWSTLVLRSWSLNLICCWRSSLRTAQSTGMVLSSQRVWENMWAAESSGRWHDILFHSISRNPKPSFLSGVWCISDGGRWQMHDSALPGSLSFSTGPS